jgi:hypothetical protein
LTVATDRQPSHLILRKYRTFHQNWSIGRRMKNKERS